MTAPTTEREQARVEREQRRLGYITDPDQIAAIAARVAFGERPWWQRMPWRRPTGWART